MKPKTYRGSQRTGSGIAGALRSAPKPPPKARPDAKWVRLRAHLRERQAALTSLETHLDLGRAEALELAARRKARASGD